VPAAAAAEAEPGPICTDRPAKANAVCTVPAGTFQLETNTIGWSLTRAAGAQTKVLTVGSSFVKLGLTNRSDLEVQPANGCPDWATWSSVTSSG
jgi:hypothetical protein